jgi:DNA (cytosine-5)-methyltransferase 1
MGLVFGSVCSGIEATSVAWEPLGWKAAWLSEIEPFPNAVLAHRYPEIPNLGDMTQIHETSTFKKEKIDLLAGGTPCQSFSRAGLRLAFDDPRGNLALKFLGLIQLARPEWVVWENVAGVLTADEGRSFEEFLRQLQKLGYGFAWRVLDSQYFGIPQRRRRLILVGHRGDWRRAADILFEPESLRGNTSPHARKRQKCSVISSGSAQESQIIGADVYNYAITGDVAATFGANSGQSNSHGPKLIDNVGIRKLTPIEVERLMGFPDDFTRVPHKGKLASECLDSWRYKALGNSIVIPVIAEVGARIERNRLKHCINQR